MAAAATEMGLLPGTRSSSTAFLAMKVAAICTCLGKPRFEQKRDMKSPVVMRSTLVSSAFRINLKHLPISFLEIRETAQISVEGRKLVLHETQNVSSAFFSMLDLYGDLHSKIREKKVHQPCIPTSINRMFSYMKP